MMRSNGRCRFELYWDPEFRCPHEIEKDGLCLFHIPKSPTAAGGESSEGTHKTTAGMEEKFQQKLTEFMQAVEHDPDKKFYDFRGFCFPSVTFNGQRFLKKAGFGWASFGGETNFEKAVFFQDVDFSGTTFHQKVNFKKAVFKEKNIFVEVVFKNEANFQEAEFGPSEFYNAQFDRLANFDTATFNGEANFYSVSFLRTVNFRMATFGQSANFLGTTFHKDSHFIGSHTHRCFKDRCDFTGLKLSKNAVVTFERVNLKQATFLDTNLEPIGFRDVDWYHTPKIGPWMSRQQSLWDEFHFSVDYKPNKSDYEKIGENYSQLVLKYELKRDFNSAENFHIGEMEMLRKKKGAEIESLWLRKLREWMNGYGLYRLSSNYGTSYVQSFIILFLLLLLFSLSFLYAGFHTSKEVEGASIRVVEYNLLPDSNHHPVSLGQWFSDYGSALSLSFSIITFQKDRFYEPLEGISRLLLYLAIFMLTAQAALILLAVRRRFKR